MLKEIPKSDVITRPIKVYKEWTLDENDIHPVFGVNGANTFVDIDNDETSYGFNKKVIYSSIKSQFYTNPATASLLTEVGRRISYASTNERIIEDDIALFSIPQVYYGEGIKPGTVVLEDAQLGRTYVDDGYSNLVYNNQIKGNVFYDRGLVVVTKDIVSASVLSQFTLNFRSTKTIYENEIFLSVLENEFNTSQNPSAVTEYGGVINTHIVQRPGSIRNGDLVTASFYNAGTKIINDEFSYYEDNISLDPTGSYLAPYITTIGLYDDDLNMVAVAKLPQPIKSTPDYPVNFIVRFDS
jgi:hypothetical protein